MKAGTRRILRAAGDLNARNAVFLAAALALAWYARHVLFLTFAGVLIATLLQSVSRWLANWTSLKYQWALFLVVVCLVSGATLVIWIFGSRIASQLFELSQNLPATIRQLRERIEQSDQGKFVVKQLSNIGEWLTSGGALSQVTSSAITAFDGLIGLIVMVFIGLYGAISPKTYTQGIVCLFPPMRQKLASEVLQELYYGLRHWMLGHLATMVIVGVLAGAGLSLLNISESLVLGLLAFCAELVPYIGPVLASLPAILLGWSQSPVSAVWVIALYLGIHIVEGYLIYPWIMRRAAGLPPALTIFAVVFFGLIGGLLGAILATPLMLVILIAIRETYVREFMQLKT